MRRLRMYTGKLTYLLAALLLFVSASATARPAKEVPPHMQERVQSIFTQLSTVIVPLHPEVAEYTIEAVIEKTPNAWINRNNEIYVSSGLLELLSTDDQLAGVIGHEIAHGTEGHIPHRVSQSLWSAFAVVALGTWAGSQGTADWGGLLHMRDLFMYAFSREQESEADLVGMRYSEAAGYASEGLVEALRLMDQDRRRLPSDSIWQELYRTHPSMSQRIADLRFVLATERLDSAPLRGTSSPVTAGARSPEAAAQGFGRALLSGDEEAMRPFVLPGRAGPLLGKALSGAAAGDEAAEYGTGAGPSLTEHIGPAWAKAELEVVARLSADVEGDGTVTPVLGISGANAALSTTLVVRLWRPASVTEVSAGVGVGPDGAEMVSPVLSLTLQRSARGWVVTAWHVTDDTLIDSGSVEDAQPSPPVDVDDNLPLR